MNEPKRRGRPPKDAAIETAGLVRVDFSAEAQAYAQRIWDGQSPSLTRHERLGRIADALEAQGLSMEGVSL